MLIREMCRRVVTVAVLVAGLLIAGTAAAQPVKAELGQRLLSRTLADRIVADVDDRADASQWRPWGWAQLAPIGELHFPALDERRVIVDSASGEALAWGAGHMEQTALPGQPGVAVIAGHRDGVFALLDRVAVGDPVELLTLEGTTLKYVIDQRLVVDSTTVQLPVVHAGPDELVLTTCWPIDALTSGPERLLLRAKRST